MPKKDDSSKRSKKLQAIFSKIEKAQAEKNAQYTRQVSLDDPFNVIYEDLSRIPVLKIPYNPYKMYALYEESGPLSACVEAMVQNIDGYGYRIVPKEGSEMDLPDSALKEKERLLELFENPNGFETFNSIRRQVRRDFFVTGNGYIEVVRDLSQKPSMLFWADAKRIRLCAYGDDAETEVIVTLPRGGKEVTVPVKKKFRKYVMLTKITGPSAFELRYFKEFGDPRVMDALTGEYWPSPKIDKKNWTPATELIHDKFGNDAYGVPLWIGTVLNVMGTSAADFVNFDLFDSQGIPPLIITVAGGELTDESFDDLVALFTKSKTVKNFNKVLILQADSTTITSDGREAVPKLDIMNMGEFRKEDALFEKYLQDGRDSIRKFGFRLPGLFVGDHLQVNFSTAKTLRELAEEQIFIPFREKFDELVNMTIVKELGIENFRFKTKGPVIKSSEDVITIFPQLLKSGVFSMNELVEFTNTNFGLNLKPYEEDWADLPIVLLLHFFQSLGMALGQGEEKSENVPNALGGLKPSMKTLEKVFEYFTGEKESDEKTQDDNIS